MINLGEYEMKLKAWILSLTTLSILSVSAYAAKHQNTTNFDAVKAAKEAYIYGYPLVTMDVTRQVMTNTSNPNDGHAPMGQFANMRAYPTPDFHEVTTPNADTLYSVAWIDLSKEPYVLHVPEMRNRYYLMPMLSGWTDVFASPGTRTTGTDAHDFLITGPNWKGKTPHGLTVYKSPTNMVWILGRTYSTGTKDDDATVHALQDQYKLTPLSFYDKPYTAPSGNVDSNIDMKTPVRDQVNHMDANTFFHHLAMLLQANPPAKADASMVKKMAKLGITAGKDFDIKNATPEIAAALNASVQSAQDEINQYEQSTGKTVNGWHMLLNTGSYGTNYLQRAVVASYGLGANKPQDAIYAMSVTDSNGEKFNGNNKYVLHFARGAKPPVKGFWSLTMYDNDLFFTANTINRYNLNQRYIRENLDGSTDLYIQHDSPGKDKEDNWLPSPSGDFVLMLRFYWPSDAIIDGKWAPPAVKKITATK